MWQKSSDTIGQNSQLHINEKGKKKTSITESTESYHWKQLLMASVVGESAEAHRGAGQLVILQQKGDKNFALQFLLTLS